MDELRLIRGILRGRREDFSLLVERYQKPVYGVVLRQLGDPAAADEVSQVVFIRAYTALRTFRADASLKTWLLRIAVNECRSWARRNRRRREVPLDDVAEPELHDAVADSGGDNDCRGLGRHVQRLPPRQRSVLALLRGADDQSVDAWARQSDSILAAYDSIRSAEVEKRRGLDPRALLPIAAAVLIAVAGGISLRSDPVGGNAQPARAAFVLALGEPEVAASVAEMLGEPWFDGDVAWLLDPAEDDDAGRWLLPPAAGLIGFEGDVQDLESFEADTR